MTSLKTTGPVGLSALDMSELIRAANAHHDEIVSLTVSALDHAFCSGAALVEAKSRLDHGEWLPWLEENFGGDRSTAAKYMRLYERQGELPKCSATLHLTIDQAAKLLSAPKPRSEPKPEPVPEGCLGGDVVKREAVKPALGYGNSTTEIYRYVATVHERWPEGESRRHLIACLRQAADRLEKLEAQNGGEQ